MLQVIIKLRSLIARSSDDGATMVEYGLIVFAIAVTVFVAATTLGDKVSSLFASIAGAL